MNVLSLNPGSSSLKVGLFGETPLYREALPADAIGAAIQKAQEQGRIDAVACRVVHGGGRFTEATLVGEGVLKAIEELAPLAPLHNAADLKTIRAVQKALPNIPVYAVFDTAFHRTIPPVASTYALPHKLAERHGLRRYGFHGISYAHAAETLKGVPRLVVCHLGNGASVCAIRDGKSVDTSMGMTPLEGLAMGTRSGDLDPGLVLHLLGHLGMSAEEVDDLLNHQSGLLGLSGLSADVRELSASTDKRARLALDVFAYRVAKYVGAFAAVLGGLDGLAFTGGIGEHSPEVRAKVCERLAFLNVHLEEKMGADGFRTVHAEGSIPVWIVPADEELQMAREVKVLCRVSEHGLDAAELVRRDL